MSEYYTAAAQAALSAGVYHEQVCVEIDFPGYTFRATDMPRDLVVNGNTYIATGTLGAISIISEVADVSADPIQLQLSGIDTNVAAELRDFTHQGSPVQIFIVLIDQNDAVIADPVTVFVGVVDTMSLAMTDTLTITVQADSYLRLLFRGPDGARRMQASQQSIFAPTTDVGLEYAASLKDTIPWGIPGNPIPNGGGYQTGNDPFLAARAKAIAGSQQG